MSILDILIVFIIIRCIVRGYFKGAIVQITNVIVFILGVILFSILYPLANSWFLNSSFYVKIFQMIGEHLKISELFNNSLDLVNSENLAMLSIPDFLKEKLLDLNNLDTLSFLKVDTVADYITAFITNIVGGLILGVIVIVIVSVLLSILVKIFNIVKKIPILAQLDKGLGVLFGIINGIFKVWLFGIIVIVLILLPQFSWIKNIYENSRIAMNIFEENVLTDFLISLITSALK